MYLLCDLDCRIHIHSGRVDTSDAGALARAEETYIANLKYAADKCAEVQYIMCVATYVRLSFMEKLAE